MSRKSRKAERARRRKAKASTLEAAGQQVPNSLTFTADTSGAVEWLAAAEGEGEEQLRRFAMTAYTGDKMRPSFFYRDVVVDLSGLSFTAKSRPVLRQHDPQQIVGHTDGIDNNGKRLKISGVISGVGEAAQEVIATSANKFPWQASIGCRLDQVVFVDEDEKVEVNGRKFTGPLLVARKATLSEVSFVPLGADDKTSARVAAESSDARIGVLNMDFAKWVEAEFGLDVATLTDESREKLQAKYDAEHAEPDPPKQVVAKVGTDGADEKGSLDLDALAAKIEASLTEQADKLFEEKHKALEAETQRVADIRKVCDGKHDELEAKALSEGWTAAKTELEVLRAERAKGPAIHTPDTSIKGNELEAALLVAHGKIPEDKLVAQYGDETMEAARKLQPMSLPRLFEDCIKAAGHTPPRGFGNDTIRMAFSVACPREMHAAGYTSTGLSGILGTSAYKSLLAQYDAYPSVAKRIASASSVKDFKQVTRYRLTMTGSVEKVGADGELKHGSFDEESYTNQAATWGKIVALTRQMIINDDLDAFLGIPRSLGRGCAVALEKQAFTTWMANSTSFFASGNSNVSTSSPLDTDPTGSLDKAIVLFRNQTDVNSDPIGIEPRLLLVPPTLESVAKQLYRDNDIAVVGTSGTVSKRMRSNPHVGDFEPLISPWLETSSLTGYSTSTWYLLADPSDVAALEIAYLNGQQSPTIESGDVDFNQLGMQWRCYFDFGVSYQDYRAAVRATA